MGPPFWGVGHTGTAALVDMRPEEREAEDVSTDVPFQLDTLSPKFISDQKAEQRLSPFNIWGIRGVL